MFTIIVDNENYSISNIDKTIYQFLYSINKVLPCFCYHEKLTIAGNCRMCLVEANSALVVSCAMPLVENMEIYTNSDRVVHARENVMEFLLANHPLDCPVCDQGGECDLQDIGRSFGIDRGRFYEKKRSVDNLTCFGPMIKTVMTRCIHCTRCVRFLNEYTDNYQLGILGRGSAMEIGTYVNTFISEELCGNIIDLCPVGALTSMPYAFTARPWELEVIESIDVLDSMASTIRYDVANNKILRTLPVLTETLNEDWLTNKTRFTFDAYNIQRLNYPQYNKINISWLKAACLLVNSMQNYKKIKIVLGQFIDLQSASSLKIFFNGIGCSNIGYEKSNIISDHRYSYLLKDKVSDFENFDLIIFVSLNLRMENPLLNSRLRKNATKNPSTCFYSIGQAVTYNNYSVINLGNSFKTVLNLASWKINKLLNMHNFLGLQNFNNINAKNLSGRILLSSSVSHFRYILATTGYIINVFMEKLGNITASELGLTSNSKNANMVYCVGTEHDRINKIKSDFLVYQGMHMPNVSINQPHLLLPTCGFMEKDGSYLNFEGTLRHSKSAVTPFRKSMTDVEIFRLLNKVMETIVPGHYSILSNFNKVRELSTSDVLKYNTIFFKHIDEFTASFVRQNGVSLNSNTTLISTNEILLPFNLKYNNSCLNRSADNYYSSDAISRLSKTMSLCAQKLIHTHFN